MAAPGARNGDRGRVVQTQMKKLLDLLSEDGILVDGKVVYNDTTKAEFWKDIAKQLNAVPEGVYKNPWKWCKMWADWKVKTKKKANILSNKKNNNSVTQPTPLTNLEHRVLKLIGYPIENDEDTQKLKMVKDEVQYDFQMEFSNEEELTDTSQSHTQNVISDEDNKSLVFAAEQNGSNFNKFEIILDDNPIPDEQGESSGEEYIAQNKEKLYKRRKQSIEEYKMKTTIKLEKERIQQKSEEMRLKAIELKLKGEELKLMEIEMNKINYLTNIEEEKLKCFKEISSSLKLLLERTDTGNLRFQNGI